MSPGWKMGAAKVVGALTDLRNRLYDKKILNVRRVDCPVISVGNLTVGGTGKTPVTLALADFYLEQKREVGIVSRNYKAQIKEIAQVDPSRLDGADYFGDEPFLLATSRPRIPIFVGPKKSETAPWALKHKPSLDVLLVDDGFQHRALHRDFDIVLLDATDAHFYETFPLGRARENRQGLERANWILITKSNWVDEENLNWIYSLLPEETPVTEVHFHTQWPQLKETESVGVFAGIARPEVFFDLARKKYFSKVRSTWTFRDHQHYGPEELTPLRRFLEMDPQHVLVTTEKDAIKIEDPFVRSRIRVAPVTIEFQQGEKFFERLRSLVL